MSLDRTFSGYRSMWLMVMFDLPTETKDNKSDYRHFREGLIDDGFMQLQYSVYARYCATDEILQVHVRRVTNAIPSDGQIRILSFTDKQFERMMVFYGRSLTTPEPPPMQISMF